MSALVQTGAAVAPVVVVLALLALRSPSLLAGSAGLVAALVGAITVFRPDDDEVLASLAQLGPTVLEVALILLGGVLLATALSATGSRDHIAGWLERVGSGDDRVPAILLLVFGLTPFMESVTGFGLGVVITAPLLVRMGLSPVKAVVTGLLGLVLVPWGSLGPGTLVAAELGGQDVAELGYWSALLTLPVLLVSMTTVLVVVSTRPSARHVVLGAAVVVTQWAALVAANAAVGVPPSGILASTAVIALLLGVGRARHGVLPAVTAELGRALIPFAVLLAGILGASAVLALAGAPAGTGWLTSPALWVNVAALVALRVYTTPGPPVTNLVRTALATWVPVAGNAIVFMSIGVVMAAAGMAAHLADLASGFGPASLAGIPAIGALGGYLTGTNTGAAAMFSSATSGAATGLGADSLVTLAGQNVGGSFAIIVSPPRVALAVGVVMAGHTRLPGAATRTLATAVVAATIMLCAAVAVLA
ncbi:MULTISPECIES: L-lactate permease [Dietzia]|uniref:L-lactate permease n=1 Tax=Dietzia maris TaxID=37915 RepID=A0ABT8GX64_9ACTN|nr:MULTISPECIES: L-lactate permease [Dietzia]MVZ89580.1 L-lactate permease [Microbacter sp. ANSKLAB05]MBB1011813.1 L-lactate permease [Dietzia kunjamensis]MCZ4541035.1 L-lactate permease [Dietzia maris]MDN4504803.1 L-lactate permease [Dietzia maris]MDV3355604.1 L-lactate permease [Dietzia sp. IN118]